MKKIILLFVLCLVSCVLSLQAQYVVKHSILPPEDETKIQNNYFNETLGETDQMESNHIHQYYSLLLMAGSKVQFIFSSSDFKGKWIFSKGTKQIDVKEDTTTKGTQSDLMAVYPVTEDGEYFLSITTMKEYTLGKFTIVLEVAPVKALAPAADDFCAKFNFLLMHKADGYGFLTEAYDISTNEYTVNTALFDDAESTYLAEDEENEDGGFIYNQLVLNGAAPDVANKKYAELKTQLKGCIKPDWKQTETKDKNNLPTLACKSSKATEGTLYLFLQKNADDATKVDVVLKY